MQGEREEEAGKATGRIETSAKNCWPIFGCMAELQAAVLNMSGEWMRVKGWRRADRRTLACACACVRARICVSVSDTIV